MRNELKYFISVFLLGAGLVVYANQTFATKESVKSVKDILKVIDQRVYDIHSKLVQPNK